MKPVDIGIWLYQRADTLINLSRTQGAPESAVSSAVARELRVLWDTIRTRPDAEENRDVTLEGIREQHRRWQSCDPAVATCDGCSNALWCEAPVGHCEQIDFLLKLIDNYERSAPTDLQGIRARLVVREENERLVLATTGGGSSSAKDIRELLGHVHALTDEKAQLLARVDALESKLWLLETPPEEQERVRRELLYKTILEVVGEDLHGVRSSKELLGKVRAKGVNTTSSQVVRAIWAMVDDGRLVMNRDCILVLPPSTSKEIP